MVRSRATHPEGASRDVMARCTPRPRFSIVAVAILLFVACVGVAAAVGAMATGAVSVAAGAVVGAVTGALVVLLVILGHLALRRALSLPSLRRLTALCRRARLRLRDREILRRPRRARPVVTVPAARGR